MSEINLGYLNGLPVRLDRSDTINGSVVLIGASGSGKTVEMQRLACEIVESGGNVLIISQHGTMGEDQIFPYYKGKIDQYRTDTYAAQDGIEMPLFTPLTYPDGQTEREADMIGALADVFSRGLKLGRRQRSVLSAALTHVVDTAAYEKDGLRSIGIMLKRMGTKESEALFELLEPLFRRNPLRQGENLLEDGKINIIHLDKFDLTTQSALMEILLSYIWRAANADQFKKKNLYLFLDECQNIASGANSPLALMLSEGRKMGINLILATQLVSQSSNSAVQQRLSQAGLMLFFKPAASQVNVTAKIIAPLEESQWILRLKSLKRGEFVAVGNFLVDGTKIDYPLVINADVEKIKNFEHEQKYHCDEIYGKTNA